MARNSNTEARRAEITGALLAVIARHGYEKATIQAIAAQAGLAPGLIHYHFKNKREILVSLIAAMAEAANARYATVLGDQVEPAARLRAYLHARLGLGEGAAPEIVAAWVMIGAEAVRQPEVRSVYQRMVADELALLATLLGDCLRAAGRVAEAAMPLAAGLAALIAGAYQLSSATTDVMPRGYAAEAATRYAELAVAAAPMRR
jgi:TetR/AcrR family transcriptional regulator, transcriptional repressor of bet genes